MSPRLQIIRLGLLSLLLAFPCHAAETITHWRFEGAANLLLDDGANHLNLTSAGSPSPSAFEFGATGSGSLFPRLIGTAGNTHALSLSGGFMRVENATGMEPQNFTIEALVHQTTRDSNSSSIMSRWDFGTGSYRAWNFAVAGTSPPAGRSSGELMLSLSDDGATTNVIGSGMILETGKDYYVSTTFAPGSTTFRVKDLAGTTIQYVRRSHTIQSVKAVEPAVTASRRHLIGSYSNGLHLWKGLIDEIRFSSGVRNHNELMVDGTTTAPVITLLGTPSQLGGGFVTFADPGETYVIRYTLDGSEPSTLSPIYESPIPIPTETTVKARVFGEEGIAPGPLFSRLFEISAYQRIGPIRPRHAKEIAGSTWSVGGETLDRQFAEYSKYKDWLGPLGVKAIRLQAGWARTEKVKGVYDWAWLDEPVYDSVSQGVKPWINVSYGNSIYTGGGGTGLGGAVPSSNEAKAAWDAWLTAMVNRYKDAVDTWEIWNEPVGPVSAADYTELYLRSAQIIRNIQPNAKLIAIGFAGIDLTYLDSFLSAVSAQGKLGLIDEISYHAYIQVPENHYGTVQNLRNRITTHAGTGHIKVYQGENGAPSQQGGYGALSGYDWTEKTQAKWNLRRMMGDFSRDIATNVFTLMELQYTTGLNSKGLLKRRSDQSVERAKEAYFAVRNVTALFDNRVRRITPFSPTHNGGSSIQISGYERTDLSAPMIVLWKGGSTPSDNDTITEVDVLAPQMLFQEPVLADLRTGSVMRIPSGNWGPESGGTKFHDLPVTDSPIVIADRAAIHSAYDRWVLDQFSETDALDLSRSGKAADPDGDGVCNLLDFGFGRARGTQGSPLKITRSPAGATLEFNYLPDIGVGYIVEASSDLRSWQVIAEKTATGTWITANPGSQTTMNPVTSIGTARILDREPEHGESTPSSRFMRVRVR